MTLRSVVLGLLASTLFAACVREPPPPPEGLWVRLGPEAREIGEAMAATKAPRLTTLGRRLASCREGATVAAPRVDADLIASGVTCSPQPEGVSGSLVRGADAWRFTSRAGGLDITPPAGWRPPPSIRGISAPGAWLTLRWWADPSTLVGLFPPDIVPRALALGLTGELALVVMAPPSRDRPPRLAFGLGLRAGVSPTLVTRAIEDASTRLGGRAMRESTPIGERHCIPGLEIAEGFQPCALVLNEGFVIVGMDAHALDAVTPTSELTRGEAFIEFESEALAAADAVVGVPTLDFPMRGARVSAADTQLRLEMRR